jgi:predicted RNase H-like nuclease (RuvC/YqgF family)
MSKSKIQTLSKKMYALRQELAKLEAEYADLRLKCLQEVEITGRGETVTLTRGARVLKAKKVGVRHRWRVWENKAVLINEYTDGNLHDIRFLLATDQI